MSTRRAYLGLGSNLGDRAGYLQRALEAIAERPGITVVGVSPVYETEPIGPPQPEYLNAVIAVDTDWEARDLLGLARDLEAAAQRKPSEHWGPRTLDVDLLLFGDDRIDDDELQVPHPRMYERGFVCVPLHDLDPGLVPPPLDGTWDGVELTDITLVMPER